MVWADELRLGLRGQVRRVWAPVGVKVRQRLQLTYVWRYLALAVDGVRGTLRWCWQSNMKKESTVKTVRTWQDDGVAAVVWDNAPNHKARMVHDLGLPLVGQPPYAPELNPAERVFEELRKVAEGVVYPSLDEKVKFMVECYNREVQGLDDVEIWIHTCWGNPNMQRVMEDTSYRASFELYLNEMRGDVWTIETKDRNFADIELFAALKGKLPKKICIGAVSHRVLQADRAEDVANAIRTALKHIAPEQLIVSSDCGFGRQGANREIAFYKASAIAQGCNIVRKELGLPTTYVPAADPTLQLDIVPKTAS